MTNDVNFLIDENNNKYYFLKDSILNTYDKNITNISKDIKVLFEKIYYKNKLIHREDGPAIEWSDGVNHWYQNGLLHRENGPAISNNGNEEYYINGIKVSAEKFNLEKELRENLNNNNLIKKTKI